jgi:hypothetical protein
MVRCSICYTVLDEREPVADCPDCQQQYHAVCWDEIGGCGTYGCKRAAVAEKPPPPVLVGAGWGDEKPCPACNRAISASLLVCRCGARFPWADPMTVADYQRWLDDQAQLTRARKVLIAIFILSLSVVASPIVGPIAGGYAHARRKVLAGTGGTYLAMGYGSAILGGLSTLLILLTVLWP